MKLFHLSDLHIGKQLNGYSLRENQEAVLSRIVKAAEEHRPDVILICGDIYDKSVPSGEACDIFNQFLENMADIRPQIPVLIIAGNHDSPERLRFASSFLERHQIYISVLPPEERGEYLKKVTLYDEYGPVNFYMLPFMRPGFVRRLIEKERTEGGKGALKSFGYEEAVHAVLEREEIREEERNVLLSHQFYIGGERQPDTCDSELAAAAAGGLDSVDIKTVSAFDYVALGHLHGPQKVGNERIWYCGSPFKYSVSEEHHKKAVTVVTIPEKGGDIMIDSLPLQGIQDVRRERGTLEEILKRAEDERRHDFVSVVLTDEKEIYNFREKLGEKYDHLLEIKVDNERTRRGMTESEEEIRILSPIEAFQEFYEAVRHCPMTEAEYQVMKQISGWTEELDEEER